MTKPALDFSKKRNLEALDQVHEAEQGAVIYAGFGIRFVASLIDGIVFNAVSAVFRAFAKKPAEGAEVSVLFKFAMANLVFLTVAVFLVYCLPLYTWSGQTIGKKVMKIRIINSNGGELGLNKIILRETVGKTASTFTLMIGYLMAAFREDRRALHDSIAGTHVVKVQD